MFYTNTAYLMELSHQVQQDRQREAAHHRLLRMTSIPRKNLLRHLAQRVRTELMSGMQRPQTSLQS